MGSQLDSSLLRRFWATHRALYFFSQYKVWLLCQAIYWQKILDKKTMKWRKRLKIPAWPALLKLKTSGIKLSSLWLYIKVRNDSQLQSSARFGVTNLEQCVCPTHYPKCEIFSFYGSMGGSGRRLPLIQLGTGPRSLKRRFSLKESSFPNFIKKNSKKGKIFEGIFTRTKPIWKYSSAKNLQKYFPKILWFYH